MSFYCLCLCNLWDFGYYHLCLLVFALLLGFVLLVAKLVLCSNFLFFIILFGFFLYHFYIILCFLLYLNHILFCLYHLYKIIIIFNILFYIYITFSWSWLFVNGSILIFIKFVSWLIFKYTLSCKFIWNWFIYFIITVFNV